MNRRTFLRFAAAAPLAAPALVSAAAKAPRAIPPPAMQSGYAINAYLRTLMTASTARFTITNWTAGDTIVIPRLANLTVGSR